MRVCDREEEDEEEQQQEQQQEQEEQRQQEGAPHAQKRTHEVKADNQIRVLVHHPAGFIHELRKGRHGLVAHSTYNDFGRDVNLQTR